MVKLGFIHSSGQVMAIQVGYNRIPIFTVIDKGIPTYPSSLMGLKLSKAGIIQENPDLKDMSYEQMKQIAVKRFHEKLKTFNSHQKVIDYIVNDLKKIWI